MKTSLKQPLVLALFTLLFLTSNAQDKKYVELINSQKLLDDGLDAYKEEKYEKSISFYEQVPRGDTNYFTAQYEISLGYYQLEKYEKVIEISRRLIAEGSPELAQINLLGSALDDLKRTEEAIAVYDEALKKYPYSVMFLLNKAIVYEKAEDYKKAYEAYQKVLSISPLYPSAHLRLAYMAEKEGKLTNAAMAFAIFLMLEPSGNRSIDALDEFNKMGNNSSTLVGKMKTNVIENDFEDIDFLITNQVALNNKYKVPGKFKYPLNKQLYLVMQKLAEYDGKETGFFSKHYLPFFKDFIKTQSYEYFSLLMLGSSKNETIVKEINKSIANVKKSRDAGMEKLKKLNPKLDVTTYGKTESLDIFYYNNFALEALGTVNTAGKNTGNWVFFDNDGFIDVLGSFNNNGERVGTWYYFNSKKDTTRILNYVNGSLNGEYKSFRNGFLRESGTYLNGKLDGTITEYYPDGTVSGVEIYTNDLRNGAGKQYYSNGALNYEYTFTLDKLNGSLKEYFDHGVLKEESNYKDGKLEGKMLSYYENKKLQKECVYVNNQLEGPYKTYYQNGQTEQEGIAVKGNTSGKWTKYYSDGKVKSISNLDENGKINGEEESFDHQGRKYRTDTYIRGEWKRVQVFNHAGKSIYDVKISKSGTKVSNYGFQLYIGSEGTIASDERDGEWKFFLPNGYLSSTELYKKGKLDGLSKNYHENGKVSGIYNYTLGSKNGQEVLFYENGNVKSEGNYINGKRWGFYNEYSVDGKLENQNFYHNNKRRAWGYEYNSNGTVAKKLFYENGVTVKIHQCDTNGITIDSAEFPTGSAKVVLKGASGKKGFEGTYLEGYLHGPVTNFYANGKVFSKGDYFMGYRHGNWEYYWPNGKLNIKSTYYHGDREGVNEIYNFFGERTKSFGYKDNQNHGKNIWYYSNGKIETESEIFEGERHNATKYYTNTGEIREIRYYEYGKLIGYSYLGKDGKLMDTIYTPSGDAVIKSYFPNGNMASSYEIKNGVYNGVYKIFYADGKLQEERLYEFGQEVGPTKSYFPDGKIQSVENFINGVLYGEALEYNANGTLRQKLNYVNDNLQGVCEYFDTTGKRTNAYYYYDNLILSVIQ
ncbi:MAG: tetratricopeptide repeat protein [Bacteroidia bacterium]|nr:tetratricopeptide repeat protein [Bacteroidia bacterium]MCF8446353.1 tetratricopeptide repeat protein [Bacteroidia bacterium]